MTNQYTDFNNASQFKRSLQQNNIPTIWRYYAEIDGATPPENHELFIDGQPDLAIHLPNNSLIVLDVVLTAWSDSGVVLFKRQVAYQANEAGAVTNVAMAGADNISVAPGSETLLLVTNAGDGKISLVFTGAANTAYKVAATVVPTYIGKNSRNAGPYLPS